MKMTKGRFSLMNQASSTKLQLTMKIFLMLTKMRWGLMLNPKHMIQCTYSPVIPVTCLAISSDSTLALTGSKDGSVHTVNITTGKVVRSLVSHTDSIECIEFAPSPPWAATGSMDQKLIIWDLQHSSPRSTCDHEEGVTWFGTSRYLITDSADGKVRVWDSLSSDSVRTFSGHLNVLPSISVSANRDFLVSVSLDGTARVFDIAEFQ
ncbi:hypothetical protein Dsin_002215 [Dipteronia sinensis]|uniref:Uncharacterized protein n=1 Tax=Dipteronia sinensis TaxID=43782 RepID=A0AAE0EJG9_9ROSI|nr:hypothetical protein Dsin_002215 [Dipteronia sinensis]